MKQPEESDAVSEVKHRYDNSFVSLQYVRVNKSTMYITMHKRKAPITMLSCSNAPNAQEMWVRNKRKTVVIIYVTKRVST